MAWTDPADWTTGELVTAVKMNAQLRDNLEAVASVGDYKFKLAAPTQTLTEIDGGWLECNESSFTGTAYADLRDLLDTLGFPFGGTFATPVLPGLSARTFVAAAAVGHTDMQLGLNEGVAYEARRQKHRHDVVNPTVDAHDHGGGAHGHTLQRETKDIHIFQSGQESIQHAILSMIPSGGGAPEATAGIVDNAAAFLTNEAPGTSGGTVGPQSGFEPTDSGAYLVAGIVAIKF